MKVVILGKGLMLANLILGAKDAGAEILGVFRYEQTSVHPIKLFFKDFFNPEPELTLIKQLNLNQIRLKSANSKAFKRLLINFNVDLLIVGTWREKLKKEIYNIPTIGTINAHPSLLPKYRGPNPYIQAILNGEEYSGITLHLVDEKFDNGPILSQEKIKIKQNDTSKELREKTVRHARKLICNLITDLNHKSITPINQSDKNATYFPNIKGDEKMLDFTSQTSEQIIRTVRALHPFLPTYITYKNHFFIVNPYNITAIADKVKNATAGDIISKNPKLKSLTIVCKDQKALRFNNLKLYKFPFLTSLYIDDWVDIKS